jgi:hypothetical protein
LHCPTFLPHPQGVKNGANEQSSFACSWITPSESRKTDRILGLPPATSPFPLSFHSPANANDRFLTNYRGWNGNRLSPERAGGSDFRSTNRFLTGYAGSKLPTTIRISAGKHQMVTFKVRITLRSYSK